MQWNSFKNQLKILLAPPLAPFWLPLGFLGPSQIPFGSLCRPWGSICLHLAPVGVHFASIFCACWLHFGYFLVLGEGIPFIAPLFRFRLPFLAPFWVNFGGQNRYFFYEKSYRFFNRFFMDFCCHCGRWFPPKLHQKSHPKRKSRFHENERLVQARARFSRSGGLNILAKDPPKSIKKTMHFWSEKCIENWSQNEAPRHYKLGKKTFKKQH